MAVIKRAEVLACDFCGKDQDQVTHLVCGPEHVCICNECIARCVETIGGSPSPCEPGAPSASSQEVRDAA